jgi:hypothetical protein
METADQLKEATQLQITYVNKDSINYLINMGISVRLGRSSSQTFISKLNVESIPYKPFLKFSATYLEGAIWYIQQR